MKIILGTQLHTLPTGSIIQKYEPVIFGPLIRLEEAKEGANDFIYTTLSEPLLDTSDTDYYLQSPGDSERWGLYNLDKIQFCVWEEFEIKRLIALIQGETFASENLCIAPLMEIPELT